MTPSNLTALIPFPQPQLLLTRSVHIKHPPASLKSLPVIRATDLAMFTAITVGFILTFCVFLATCTVCIVLGNEISQMEIQLAVCRVEEDGKAEYASYFFESRDFRNQGRQC